MKETVYEVRMDGMVICAFNSREDAEEKARILNDLYGDDDYCVTEVQKDSM